MSEMASVQEPLPDTLAIHIVIYIYFSSKRPKRLSNCHDVKLIALVIICGQHVHSNTGDLIMILVRASKC